MSEEMKVRIPDLKTALNCIESLIRVHEFEKDGEELFKEDVKYSFMMLRGSCKNTRTTPPLPQECVEELDFVTAIVGRQFLNSKQRETIEEAHAKIKTIRKALSQPSVQSAVDVEGLGDAIERTQGYFENEDGGGACVADTNAIYEAAKRYHKLCGGA